MTDQSFKPEFLQFGPPTLYCLALPRVTSARPSSVQKKLSWRAFGQLCFDVVCWVLATGQSPTYELRRRA